MDYQGLIREASRRELSEDELVDLGGQIRGLFSQGGPLVVVLGQIEAAVQQSKDGILSVDLTTEEGRLAGVRTQGRIQGLLRALELIVEPVEKYNERTKG